MIRQPPTELPNSRRFMHFSATLYLFKVVVIASILRRIMTIAVHLCHIKESEVRDEMVRTPRAGYFVRI